MKLRPHIQTGSGTYLEVLPTFQLRADHNWTLSFAGSHLLPSSSSGAAAAPAPTSTSVSSSSSDVLLTSSLSPCCHIQYEGSNKLGLYLAGVHSHPSTSDSGADSTTATPTPTSISLPYNPYEFHVLTLTFDQNSQQLKIYQNAEFVSALDFEDGWAAMNIVGGTLWNDRRRLVEDDESGTSGDNDDDHNLSASEQSSNLALQRLSFFHRSFDGQEELTELVQYMTSWYP